MPVSSKDKSYGSSRSKAAPYENSSSAARRIPGRSDEFDGEKQSVRSKDGCLTCRLRKKRCEGQPPGQPCTVCDPHYECLGFAWSRPGWMKANLETMKERLRSRKPGEKVSFKGIYPDDWVPNFVPPSSDTPSTSTTPSISPASAGSAHLTPDPFFSNLPQYPGPPGDSNIFNNPYLFANPGYQPILPFPWEIMEIMPQLDSGYSPTLLPDRAPSRYNSETPPLVFTGFAAIPNKPDPNAVLGDDGSPTLNDLIQGWPVPLQ